MNTNETNNHEVMLQPLRTLVALNKILNSSPLFKYIQEVGYLVGSYRWGTPTPKSDIDFIVSKSAYKLIVLPGVFKFTSVITDIWYVTHKLYNGYNIKIEIKSSSPIPPINLIIYRDERFKQVPKFVKSMDEVLRQFNPKNITKPLRCKVFEHLAEQFFSQDAPVLPSYTHGSKPSKRGNFDTSDDSNRPW